MRNPLKRFKAAFDKLVMGYQVNSKLSELFDLVWSQLTERNPDYGTLFNNKEIKSDFLADLKALFPDDVSDERLKKMHEVLTSKYPERQVIARYLFIHWFELSILKSGMASQHQALMVNLLTNVGQWLPVLSSTLRLQLDFSLPSLIDKAFQTGHKINEVIATTCHSNARKYTELLGKWRAHFSQQHRGVKSRQDTFETLSAVKTPPQLPVNTQGSGLYQLDGDKLYYCSATHDQDNVADDIAPILVTALNTLFPSCERFLPYQLFKSQRNEVFSACEYLADYNPLLSQVFRVTLRMSQEEQAALKNLPETEKHQLREIIAHDLLLADRDCNGLNIGRTDRGLIRLDPRWALASLAEKKPLLLCEESLPVAQGRVLPSNYYSDYLELMLSEDFVSCVQALVCPLKIYQAESLIRTCLEQVLQAYENTVVPSPLYRSEDTPAELRCYSKRHLIAKLLQRVGVMPTPVNCTTPELLTSKLVEGLTYRKNALLLLAKTIEIHLSLTSSRRQQLKLHNAFIAHIKETFKDDWLAFDSTMPDLAWQLFKLARSQLALSSDKAVFKQQYFSPSEPSGLLSLYRAHQKTKNACLAQEQAAQAVTLPLERSQVLAVSEIPPPIEKEDSYTQSGTAQKGMRNVAKA